MRILRNLFLVISGLAIAILGSAVSEFHFGEWRTPVNAELIEGTSTMLNTAFNDGCPYQSPDGLTLFLASNRPGGLGGQDIWVATRESVNDPWGDPLHLPAPVNSERDDFCPSPVRGHGLYFVSKRFISGVSCGSDTGNLPTSDTDIFFTRYSVKASEVDWENPETWEDPQHLGCQINSMFQEWSPSYFEGQDGQVYLYFASLRTGGPGATNDADIYESVNFGSATIVLGINTEFDDHRPNVRKDGLEIVFDSTRDGFVGAVRNSDIWTATRASTDDDWNQALHLPEPVNNAAADTRATLSWDGRTMYFGSARSPSEGAADIFVTTRRKLRGYEVSTK